MTCDFGYVGPPFLFLLKNKRANGEKQYLQDGHLQKHWFGSLAHEILWLQLTTVHEDSADTPSAPSSNDQVYQPFPPPPSLCSLPIQSLGTYDHLEVLPNRWASGFVTPLIPSLFRKASLLPPSKKPLGISASRNRIVVGRQERLRRDGEEEVPSLVDSAVCRSEKIVLREGKLMLFINSPTLLSYLLHDE
ncbi:hypothetical protein NE237_023333 [Protea cynaroides]|uniref:Uncharacterized protein n=1 Tax=Protea cynaroides TaxID=273540 RepID=A0A9Q0K4C8_9MAGN|nr:hypothetical protein NE237_023333 [Protea cynaroides]